MSAGVTDCRLQGEYTDPHEVGDRSSRRTQALTPDTSAGQLAVLTAVVATLFMPAAALLGALCVVLFDVSPHAFVTFGGTFNAPLGLMAWWAALLPPAWLYAILCLRDV